MSEKFIEFKNVTYTYEPVSYTHLKAQIDEAKQLLIKQKPMLKAYLVETEARDAMISGEAAMALVYNLSLIHIEMCIRDSLHTGPASQNAKNAP